MMYKNRTKIGILAFFILLATIQISMLWLGGPSSHNFLDERTKATSVPMKPSNIWLHKGNTYKISSEHMEYKRLVNELRSFLLPNLTANKAEEISYFDWNTLLNKQGIFFEYYVPVSLEEIVGAKLHKQVIEDIDRLFLNMTPIAGAKIEIYFINTSKQIAYRMEMGGEYTGIKKIYDTLNTEDMTANLMKYEASIRAVDKFIEGNVFLPLASKDNPLTYTVLKAYNPMHEEVEDYTRELSNMTSQFFENPLTKSEEIAEDGTVIFTENMKCIITYRPQGVIEYINLATTSAAEEKMTRGEGYSIAKAFVQNTDAIPDSIKSRTYLKKIIKEDGQYTYYFDMLYDGYKVKMDPSVQKELGIGSMIEVTVRNHQVSAGKWWVMEVTEKVESTGVVEEGMTTAYMEPINKMYDSLLKQERFDVLIEDIECVYTIKGLDKEAYIRWAVLVEGTWYYP